MVRYKHTQPGWVIIAVLLLVGGFFFFTSRISSGSEIKTTFLSVSFLLFLVLLLFHSLKTTVTDEKIIVSFGVGVIRKTIFLDEIEQCETKRNQFILGWGIRFGLGYTLWNVSGFDAVELSFKDKKWKFRIGTDRPQDLEDAINSAIRERQLAAKAD